MPKFILMAQKVTSGKVRKEVWIEKPDIKRLAAMAKNHKPRLKLKPFLEFILQQKAQEN